MGKIKKEVAADPMDASVKEEDTYEDKILFASPIAKPMASRKLSKKCYKLIKKASKTKTNTRTGLKDLQKALRKGETGLVIFAGDVTPVDVMSHLPGYCEEKGIPYVYTPTRADIGAAMGVKRGMLAILVKENSEYKDLYDELKSEIQLLPIPT